MKTKVKREDVEGYLLAMFTDDPEVVQMHTLMAGFDGADLDVEWADLEYALDRLLAKRVLQRAGRKGYEATKKFMRENGHEVEE